jgi:hypothetical protein
VRQPLRTHADATGKKDVDQGARAHMVRVVAGSLPGLLLGGFASVVGVAAQDWGLGTAALVTGGTWALAFFVPLGLATLGGRAARQIHNPSGRTTPPKREYSHAESLLARGLHQEAIDAFEMAIAEDPSDSAPYLRIARVCRDHTERFEDATLWFKRALRESAISPGVARLATRELVELYMIKLGDPGRAAPLLARVAEEQAGTAEGTWAARELALVKAGIAGRVDD